MDGRGNFFPPRTDSSASRPSYHPHTNSFSEFPQDMHLALPGIDDPHQQHQGGYRAPPPSNPGGYNAYPYPQPPPPQQTAYSSTGAAPAYYQPPPPSSNSPHHPPMDHPTPHHGHYAAPQPAYDAPPTHYSSSTYPNIAPRSHLPHTYQQPQPGYPQDRPADPSSQAYYSQQHHHPPPPAANPPPSQYPERQYFPSDHPAVVSSSSASTYSTYSTTSTSSSSPAAVPQISEPPLEPPRRHGSLYERRFDELDVIQKAAQALAKLGTHHGAFDTEPMPKAMDPPLLRSPLFSADPILFLNPHLTDAIGGVLPEDAWEYISIPIQSSSQSVDVPNTPEYHIIKEGHRGYAIYEVLTTERTYVKDLAIIHITVRKMLQERNIISNISMNKIFSGMEELYLLHGRFLQRLEEILSPEHWSSEDSSLATIFLDYRFNKVLWEMQREEMARYYIIYINNYSAATKQISHEETNNPEFKKFLVDCQKSNEIKHGLKDLLVRPMQRMTKYPLLIREIHKHTSKEHPDGPNLKNALEAMSNLAATVNNKMAEMVKLISLFTAFDATLNCPPTLLSANRRCLISIDALDKANKPIHLFLCSDLLMVVTLQTKVFKQSQHKYKFLRWLDLLECAVEELQNDVVKITLSEEPRQGSLTTPGSARVHEYKIDSLDPGSRRVDFMRALFQELKRIRGEKV
ncbi:hypothetical protein HDU96_010550 [Phlyctochytrium bullatum]|nr:hypothetical protein HDU96_010550 [Phlyctochytrium bullatum]